MFSGGLKTRKIIQTSPWPFFSLYTVYTVQHFEVLFRSHKSTGMSCHELFSSAKDKKEFGKKENGWVV